MKSLPDYLRDNTETQTAFAARAGLTDGTLSRVLAGKIPPSTDVVEKVHAATAGQVTANDLFEAWRAAKSGAPGASATASEGVSA